MQMSNQRTDATNDYSICNSFVGLSGVHALPLAAAIKVVPIVLGIIFLSSFFRVPYFSTRKKAGRFLQFCMGS